MRIRCSKGLRISAFHGHFFIRSTDLLALPQVPHPPSPPDDLDRAWTQCRTRTRRVVFTKKPCQNRLRACAAAEARAGPRRWTRTRRSRCRWRTRRAC